MAWGHRHNTYSLVATAIILTSCGGSDGNSSSASSATPVVASATIHGTVASGSPIAQALLTATDINGTAVTSTADALGNYTLNSASLTAPIALVATDPTGQVSPIVTVLASLPAAGQTAVVNVTTLTSALSALLTSDGNALDFATSGVSTTLKSVNAANIQKASAVLNAYLANVLTAYGLDGSFDPIATPFVANHAGADALLDSVTVLNEGAVTLLSLRVAQGGTPLTWRIQPVDAT